MTRPRASTIGGAPSGGRRGAAGRDERRPVGGQARRRRDQRAGVSILWSDEHIVGRADLDDAPARHHGDAVGPLGGDAEVVGDEEHGRAGRRGQLRDVVEDLALHGDVQRAGRLVGDHEPRPGGDGDGDQHALAHAARQLVRVEARPRRRIGDAGALERLDGGDGGVAAVGEAVDPQHLGDLRADARHGVQRDRGVLRDDADLAATDGTQPALAEPRQLLAVEAHGAADDGRGTWQQPGDGMGRRRLA